MIEVICKTDLDLFNEKWPEEMPAVPNVGDEIMSRTKWGHFQLTLQVTNVTWEYHDYRKKYVPHIELHMNNFQRKLPAKKPGEADGSIVAFYEWYAPLVGKTVGAFI